MFVRILAWHWLAIASLWLSAILTGLSADIPHFLYTLEMLYACFNSLTSAWFEVSQLFIDTPGIRCYVCDRNLISWIDWWHLLHDVGSQLYCSMPLLSWQSFEWMPLFMIELNIMTHVDCERHKWYYICWEWFNKNSIKVSDLNRTFLYSYYFKWFTKTAAVTWFTLLWLIHGNKKWSNRCWKFKSWKAESTELIPASNKFFQICESQITMKLKKELFRLTSTFNQCAFIAVT